MKIGRSKGEEFVTNTRLLVQEKRLVKIILVVQSVWRTFNLMKEGP